MSQFTFSEAPPGAQNYQPRGVGTLGGESFGSGPESIERAGPSLQGKDLGSA